MLVDVIDFSSIFLPFGIFHGRLIYFVVILVYFSLFGMMHQVKSGDPGIDVMIF
jgi:hypothetical protein